jgi:hypothetical protein
MGYKRRLHVLLVGQAVLPGPVPERLELRAASLPLAPADLAWADLLLTLDAPSRAALPPLQSRINVRHLALDGLSDDDAREALRARLEGVAGGLAMLERGGEED